MLQVTNFVDSPEAVFVVLCPWASYWLGPSTICGLSLLLVLALLQMSFSGFSSFPLSTKTKSPNSSLTGIEDLEENQLKADVASSLNVVNLFEILFEILFFIYSVQVSQPWIIY